MKRTNNAVTMQQGRDHWWKDVQPLLVNENVPAPAVNPIKGLYWKQFGGGPDEALRRQMNPVR